MKAVLLAGGQGSRFGEITRTTPKPLIKVGGKELIRHTLDALPGNIKECIIVLGHLGEQIERKIGREYNGLKISYVTQEKTGTGGALLASKKSLVDGEMFLTVGCDDIFGKQELNKLLKPRPTYGVFFGKGGNASKTQIRQDKGVFRGFQPKEDSGQPHFFGVGAYVLPWQIFREDFFVAANGELSLPHTIAHAAFETEVVQINHWLPVNNLQEKEVAEILLRL